MDRGPDRSLRGGERELRSHHISSIAHHFFDEDGPGGAVSSRRSRGIAVCGTANGPLTAWTCAQLARAVSGCPVVLGESPWLTWSATSHLANRELIILPDEDKPGASVDRRDRYWRLDPRADEDPAGSKLGADPAGGDPLVLRHLGTFDGRQLADLEAVHLLARPCPADLTDRDALVWCLTLEGEWSLTAAYTLGRVLTLLEPSHLEIIIVDPGCLNADAARPSLPERQVLEGCRRLGRSLPHQGPVHCSFLERQDRTDPARLPRVLQKVVNRILTGHDSD